MDIIKTIHNCNYYDNKNILITGGTGTLGNVLTDFFLNKSQCSRICIFSRDEFKQHNMKIKYRGNSNYNKLRFFIGDIRDKDRIKHACKGIDIVFHAAALKQVDSIEYNPMEGVNTNVIGTNNVVIACIDNNVEQLIGISTDKCVAPVNLYGATKLCLEKLILSGQIYSGNKLRTCVLRYGNVIGSRGSVVPLFKSMKNSGLFTVTDKRMTRFTLTIEEASTFILNCVTMSNGGEIFVPKLPKYTLPQLCRVINENNSIQVIGMRPGEKLHECMICQSESLNVWEAESFYIVTNDNIEKTMVEKYNLKKNTTLFEYTSEYANLITDKELLNQILC